MNNTVLLTGSSGFLGKSLMRTLSKEFEFIEIHHDQLVRSPRELPRSRTLIHLAGISSVPECEQNPLKAYEVNCALTLDIAENFFRLNQSGHFIFISSGQVYDESAMVPYDEKSSLNPPNVYARTKLIAEDGLKVLAKSLKGRLTTVRLFNQTHKTQSSSFFLPSIYHQILASSNKKIHIKVGNINVNRDLSAVGDFISAVRLLLSRDPLEAVNCFNICSGSPKNLKETAIMLGERMGKEIVFEVDPTRLRAHDRETLFGKSELFQKRYGWKPKSESISSFLDGFFEDF